MSAASRADALLAAVESAFDASPDAQALPARRYVASGQTAHDCEQVTVSFQQGYLGLPGDQATTSARCDSAASLVFLVEVVRKVPVLSQRGGAPSVEALNAAGHNQLSDAETLLDAARSFGNDFGGVLADVFAGEPSGEYQAIAANVTLANL